MDVPGEVELGPVVVDFSVEVGVSVVEVELSEEVEVAVEVKASVGVEELYVLDELEPKLEVEPEVSLDGFLEISVVHGLSVLSLHLNHSTIL